MDNDEVDGLLRFGISMPAGLVRELDEWRKRRGYENRSEAMRDLVRDALVAANWQPGATEPDAEMVGVVSIVYAHADHQVGERLTEMQHHHHATATAALHIHLTESNCLEVIVLRGPREEVLDLANRLTSARGVLHGKFLPTTTGEDIG